MDVFHPSTFFPFFFSSIKELETASFYSLKKKEKRKKEKRAKWKDQSGIVFL
jgi:hypothetical protein